MVNSYISMKQNENGNSLVAQWLRIRLAGDVGLIPGWGTRIPPASGQLRPLSCNCGARVLRSPRAPQLGRPTHHSEDPEQQTE